MKYCTNCGATLSDTQKFCSACGTPVKSKPSPDSQPEVSGTKQPADKNPERQYTKEGRKIIDSGPRPAGQVQNRKSQKAKKKKKGGCLRFFLKTVLVLFVLMIVGAVIIWNLPDDEAEESVDTDIPGIVDIKLDDNNNTADSKSKVIKIHEAKPVKENKEVKKTAKLVEDIFKKSDTSQLKMLLTEKSLKTYAPVISDIYPHMPDYAKAFKNRKLKILTNVLCVYEFNDENGDAFTVTFEMQPDGKWKLINF